MIASVKSTLASEIVVGSVERQADEQKRKTLFYYYQATQVTRTTWHNRPCVEVVWLSLEDGKQHTNLYDPLACVDLVDGATTDKSKLLTVEEHDEAN